MNERALMSLYNASIVVRLVPNRASAQDLFLIMANSIVTYIVITCGNATGSTYIALLRNGRV